MFGFERIRAGLPAAALMVVAGCAGSAQTGEEVDVAEVSAALTVMDCQTQAAECLGVLPSIGQVATCRDELQMCLGDVADEAQSQAGDLASCRDAAVDCARNAGTFGDAAMCRADFEACVGGIVTLPTLPPPPSLGLPSLPDAGAIGLPSLPGPGGSTGLPDPAGVLSSTDQCRTDAVSCVQGAAGDVAATAACADAFRQCVGDVLSGGSSAGGGTSGGAAGQGGSGPGGLLPDAGLPSVDPAAVQSCRQDAVSCVQGASGPADVQACGEAFAACVGIDTSALPSLSGLPASLPEPPDLGGGLPSLPATDCLEQLRSCVLGGGSPVDCLEQARVCAGL